MRRWLIHSRPGTVTRVMLWLIYSRPGRKREAVG